ncbi:MAG TPA: DinB family protein [Blastocatellia bacterium]
MVKAQSKKPFVLSEALLEAFATNGRINQYLIDNLDDAAWRAEPPSGKGRSPAAIVAHMHNVRVMWLKAAAKGSEIPDQLDKLTVSRAQAVQAMTVSYGALRGLLGSALVSDGKIKGFRPDVAGFVGYLISHDAHHRGQLTMLARQAGHPVSQKVLFGMWEWGSRGSSE